MSKVLVDGATGSAELVAPLIALGIPAEKVHLDYGDIAFSGRGEKGAKLWIGIEFKKVEELAQSLVSKRFQGHQLLGMVKDFDRSYLLVEGDFHSDNQGRAVVFRGRGQMSPLRGVSSAVTFEQEMLNIAVRGGVTVVNRTTRKDCLRWILACWRYWSDRDLDRHKSHLAVYAPDLDRGLLTPRSLLRQTAAQFPGIGFMLSGVVEKHFRTIQEMVNAPVSEWVKIEGIGPKTASDIVKACQTI